VGGGSWMWWMWILVETMGGEEAMRQCLDWVERGPLFSRRPVRGLYLGRESRRLALGLDRGWFSTLTPKTVEDPGREVLIVPILIVPAFFRIGRRSRSTHLRKGKFRVKRMVRPALRVC